MVAGSFLVLALSLVAAPPEGSGPPAVTLEELNAFVEAGNYHRLRAEKVGQRFQASGTVKFLAAFDGTPIVAFPGHLCAALKGLPEDNGLAVGDRVRFDGLIVDEGYACLYLWTYDFEKLAPGAEPSEAIATTATAPTEEVPTIRFCEPAPGEPATPTPLELARQRAAQAKSNEELLPKVTPADLDAAVKQGDGRSVRREMIGLRLDADAVVEKVGAWPFVRLSDGWHAHLRSHTDEFDLQEGDRIHVVGLIADEAYRAVTVWVERTEKLPAEERNAR